MNKRIVAAVSMLLIAGLAGFFFVRSRQEPVVWRTDKVERGSIVSSVSATGTLAAVVTVQVGTQVSGTIQKIFVDYNSPVRKGQVIAQVDPSLLSAQMEQSRGNYLTAQANLQKAKGDAADSRRTLERNRQLLRDGIISQSDFDAAETKYELASAAVKAVEGSVAQTRAAFSQAETNLRYATIRSPVNGTVISRSVDVGQTVAASFQTPTLFTIAQDLAKMQIDTSVDEADISRVAIGQPVTFTVDAYPERTFSGKITQIRNSPVVNQNVVTYVVVVAVDNSDLKLKPGMTANVSIETARRENVLKIPSAALRFKPKTEAAGKKPAEKKQPAPGGKGGGGQQVYLLGKDNDPVPVAVKTGIAGTGHVELLEGNLKENDELIVEQVTAKKKSGGMKSPMGPRF